MTSDWTLTVRADANPAIGHGHMMRTLAVADAVRRLPDAAVRYLVSRGSYVRPLERAGMPFAPVDDGDLRLAGVDPAAGPVLLDSYEIREADLAVLRSRGFLVAMFDDGCRLSTYEAGLVIDASPAACTLPYRGTPDARFLLGSPYIPLRRVFCEGPSVASVAERVERVAVTLGGSDPDDAARLVVEGLSGLAGLPSTTVILGASYAGRLGEGRVGPIHIVRDPSDYHELIATADLVITAAGGSAFESAALGRPILTIQTSADQRLNNRALVEAGAAVAIGRLSELTPEGIAEKVTGVLYDAALRARIAERARRLVDGRGSERIAEAIAAMWRQPRAPAVSGRLT